MKKSRFLAPPPTYPNLIQTSQPSATNPKQTVTSPWVLKTLNFQRTHVRNLGIIDLTPYSANVENMVSS